MTRFPIAIVALILAACSQGEAETAAKPQPAAIAAAQPVLVELFTSQGCSSCPPADKVLEGIAKQPNIVAISRPVTYWDRLGWKDTLAREANTTLQRAYATKGHGGAGVYTPQAVVQGESGVVGSQLTPLTQLIRRAGQAPQPKLTVASGAVAIEGRAAAPATVTLIALKSRASVDIGNGENGGRTVNYTNVVLDERPLGDWRGGKASFAIPSAALKIAGADRYALVVQQGPAGKVLAARYL